MKTIMYSTGRFGKGSHFMQRKAKPSACGVILSMMFATAASAQEILPFPPTPSASTAGLTMQDSTYKKRVEPKRLA